MSTPRRAVRKPAAKAAPKTQKKFTVTDYVNRFIQFAANKAEIAALTERNDGTKQDKALGLKFGLVEDAKAHGERDPETGSFYLDFDSPVEVGGVKWGGFKAERRVQKVLDVDKAKVMLEEKGLLDDVQKHVVTLTMDAAVAKEVAQFLDEEGLSDIVTEHREVLSEDDMLEAHYRDKANFTVEELDSLYTENETFAAVPQKA